MPAGRGHTQWGHTQRRGPTGERSLGAPGPVGLGCVKTPTHWGFAASSSTSAFLALTMSSTPQVSLSPARTLPEIPPYAPTKSGAMVPAPGWAA